MSITTKEEVMKYLAYNVVYLRKKHKISKKEMAKILGIGIKALDEIEKGVLPPRLNVEILFRINNCFGVPLSFLISENIE